MYCIQNIFDRVITANILIKNLSYINIDKFITYLRKLVNLIIILIKFSFNIAKKMSYTPPKCFLGLGSQIGGLHLANNELLL